MERQVGSRVIDYDALIDMFLAIVMSGRVFTFAL